MRDLNEGQKEAFRNIISFFGSKEFDAFVLKGYAGTGKTFLVKRIVRWINDCYKKNARIAITAPTNKAVRVLYAMGEFLDVAPKEPALAKDFPTWLDDDVSPKKTAGIDYSTIHKLLGLTETITARGEQIFTAKNKDKNDIEEYDVLIVDETSMLDDMLFKEIIHWGDKIKIIFMGDPAQIPPVNRVDCIPFRENHTYRFSRSELTEIMRQKGDNPIIEASFRLRNNLELVQPIKEVKTQLNSADHGIVHIDAKVQRDEIRPLIEKYFKSEEFTADANYAKIIAWRNKVVGYMNDVVREILYGPNPNRYVAGEKLIVSSPVFRDYGGILFNTSEELKVVGVAIKNKKFQEKEFSLDAKVYECTVEAFEAESKQVLKRVIFIIHEDSLVEFNMIATQAKERAIARRQATFWVTYYNILKWSADVAYNYAITAHKAQGSTYRNVLLMEEDIDKNPKTIERNRIKYTAYSRPTDRLYIVRENYE